MERKTATKSIRAMVRKSDRIDRTGLYELQTKLLNGIEFPRVGEIPEKANTGDTLSIKIDGLPLPDIDLYNGRYIKNRSKSRQSVTASFEGVNGAVTARGKYNRQKRSYDFEVPGDAQSGVLMLYFPIKARFGRISRTVFQRSFPDTEYCEEKSAGPPLYMYVMVPIVVDYILIRCNHCMTNPICPYGAIKFDDDDYCYVDAEICRGQSYDTAWYNWEPEVEDHEVYAKLDEQACWACFNGGETVWSDRCNHRALKRTLHIESGCCGCCQEINQYTLGICLKQLCSVGAVGGGRGDIGVIRQLNRCTRCPTQVITEYSNPYYIVEDKCIGCFDCYEYIRCKKRTLLRL